MESIPQAQSGSNFVLLSGFHGSLTHVTYFCSASGKQPDGPCVQWVQRYALECAAGLVSVVGQFCAHIPIRTIAHTACPPGPAADPPRADHRQHHQPAPERLERPRTRRPPARQTPEYAYPARRMGRPRLLHPHWLRHLPNQDATSRYTFDNPAPSSTSRLWAAQLRRRRSLAQAARRR